MHGSQLQNLYREAIKLNVERRDNFSYSLQLRKLLGIEEADAERLDIEARQQAGSFSI